MDFLELQRLIDADVLDFGVYGPAARLIEPIDRGLRLAWYQAWYAVRHWRGYRTVYSLSEDIGLPMRWLMRARGLRARHIVVAHHVRASRKRLLVNAMGGLRGFDRVVTLSAEEHDAVVCAYGVPPERAVCLPHRVDERFWQPLPDVAPEPDLVCSFGLAKRDYPTLLSAIRDLPVRLQIQAGSQWHVQGRARLGGLPANAVVGPFLEYCDLKMLYSRASVVVVALQPDAHGSAGSETILEAMAMGRPVIVATSNHLRGYVEDGVTGRIVRPGDAGALREAIVELVDNPARAAEMGQNARAMVERDMPFAARIRCLAALAEIADEGSMT